MTEKVKKRRDSIINVAFIAMVLGLVYFFLVIQHPFFYHFSVQTASKDC